LLSIHGWPPCALLAGSIFQTGAHIVKAGTGFNINGITANAATSAKAISAATHSGSKARSGGLAAPAKHVSKK